MPARRCATADPVDDAFAAVRRADFLPRGETRLAGVDQPLPIGHGQTNSQPSTVRHLLVRLEVAPGQRVLDVGSGSGWTTALLGHLVGPTGSVVGVEVVPELVDFGRANLAAYPASWTRIEPARPGVVGLPDLAPFDRILVSAEAPNPAGGPGGTARAGRRARDAGRGAAQGRTPPGGPGRRGARRDARPLPVRAARGAR